MKNKIPDRWLDYSPMGSKVAGTRFIAFKAPLSKEICSKMKPAERFTPEILMERCPNMRLIIDLTNTDRYYNKQEFIERGIQYEKIMCPGQVIPPQSLIFRFFEIIDDFYLKNGLKDVLIGIHCTHGVNRTGYFIGRYMVQRMGFHHEKAIPCIEEARGHKIERKNYIKDLMVQVPIPSSLSSSSGKKVVESKSEQKKVSSSSISGKSVSKITSERLTEKSYGRKQLDNREHTGRVRRSPETNFRAKEQSRSGNYGSSAGRTASPSRRAPSPVKRVHSPNRRGISPVRRASPPMRRPQSPGRRPASPVRRGGRAPSPKRPRTPPRSFSPRRRSSPPRRSPNRRYSPVRRESDFSGSYREEKDFSRSGPTRAYSPPRRMEPPPSNNFSSRGPPDNQNYHPPSSNAWHQDYESRNFNSGGGPTTNYGPPSKQFPDTRPPDKHLWGNRSNNQPPFGDLKPPSYGGSGPSQWNSTPAPPHDFSRPPPNINMPPPNFDSRSGFNHPPPGRFNDRRFEEPKFPPREEPRRTWNEDRPPHSGPPPFNPPGRFEENRSFSDRGNDYRLRSDDKYDKPYSRSPPRPDYHRDKRPPSPFREPRRDFDGGHSRPDEGWEARRRSPIHSFAEKDSYARSGARKRSRSPLKRVSPPRRSKSPRRRTPPRSGGYDQRRTPPRNRPGDHPPSFNHPPPMHQQGPPMRSGPEPPYQDKRFYDSRDDCREFLNQKRNFDGNDRRDFLDESKPSKLGVRDMPKGEDLRKIISNPPNEPPLKHRLGPPPRDDHHSTEVDRRFGRVRSRSPRARSPQPRYGPPRRY